MNWVLLIKYKVLSIYNEVNKCTFILDISVRLGQKYQAFIVLLLLLLQYDFNITKFIKEIRVEAEEFIGKDFKRSRNSHSTLRDPLFTESKATTWKVLCRKSGILVGSCYSCSVAVKCGLGEIVWGF